MRNGNERKSPFSTSPLHCEVALGLKMQPSASYSCDGGGGGPSFTGLNNFYELGNGLLLQRSLDASSSRPSGLMPVCGKGKALFSSSQLQELERQKIIHKYISASIPVPPQLLFSTSISPSLSQCNMELRYSSSVTNGNGSDPEPWRCKRTDGKKWRCSRDVAPDQKYCDRHAHKNRPRSRKHVEISPKSSTSLPRSSSSSPSPQFPYHQSRCFEWLMKGGNGNGDGGNRSQLEQLIPSVYHPHFAEKNDFASDDHGMSSEGSRAAATRLFIDAWGKEGMSMNRAAEKKVWPSSSLSLRMGDDKGDSGIFKNQQWPSNPISWLSSSSSSPAPGGPLGEALCLGNGGSSLVSSPHGQSHSHSHSHGYSNSNTNSSSKSSCEDGSHALNFIG